MPTKPWLGNPSRSPSYRSGLDSVWPVGWRIGASVMLSIPSTTHIDAEMLETLIEAAEPDLCDQLIQSMVGDLKQLNRKVILLTMLLDRGEPLRKTR